jgi:hypothetical protein
MEAVLDVIIQIQMVPLFLFGALPGVDGLQLEFLL